MDKNFKLSAEDIERLIPDMGYGFATDKITVDGKKVKSMVRQSPSAAGDSGWIFYGGGESQEYLDDPTNTSLFNLNTLANYDPDIISFLTYPPGTEIERDSNGELQVTDPSVPQPNIFLLDPVDEGMVKITEKWSFAASSRMVRRFDRGSIVIWRPGFAIWLSCYSFEARDKSERIEEILAESSSERTGEKIIENGDIKMLRYHLKEYNGERLQDSAHIIAVGETDEISMVIYYDNDKQLAEVDRVWESLVYTA